MDDQPLEKLEPLGAPRTYQPLPTNKIFPAWEWTLKFGWIGALAVARGAGQKYPYRWRYGIIGAKKSPVLPTGVSYAHRHCASPHGLPPSAADGTTTGLLGADCAPADESPAARNQWC